MARGCEAVAAHSAIVFFLMMEKVSSGDTTAIIYALKVYGGDFFNDRKSVEAKISGTPIAVQPSVQIYLPEKDSETGGKNGKK